MATTSSVNMNAINAAIAKVDEEFPGGSWLTAIAKAMGKAMGIQAAKLVSLSNAISENASQQAGASDSDKQALGARGAALNAEFQGASQEFSMCSNAFSTAIRSIGEACTTLSRKQ